MTRLSLCIASCIVLSGCGGGVVERVNPVNEKLKQDVAELTQKVTQSEKEKATLASETKILQTKLGESVDKNARLNEEAATLRKNSESFATEKEELQKENQRLGEERENFRKDNETLRNDSENLRKEKASLNTEKEQLEKDVLAKVRELNVERLLLQTLRTASLKDQEEIKKLKAQDQSEIKKLKDPFETFKRNSLEYIDGLQPKKLFSNRSIEQVTTFKKKLAFLSEPRHLLSEPTPASIPFTLPLPLIFDEAPRPSMGFTLFVSATQGHFDAEQNAKFILATDDKAIFGTTDSYQFKVPAGFPIIYIGRNTFMLPKTLFDPLYESEDSSKFIPLVYDFENNDDLPMGYERYLENLAAHRAKIDGAKSLATDARQKEIDAKNQPTSP